LAGNCSTWNGDRLNAGSAIRACAGTTRRRRFVNSCKVPSGGLYVMKGPMLSCKRPLNSRHSTLGAKRARTSSPYRWPLARFIS
jgi:hypothetical protein